MPDKDIELPNESGRSDLYRSDTRDVSAPMPKDNPADRRMKVARYGKGDSAEEYNRGVWTKRGKSRKVSRKRSRGKKR